MTFWRMVAGFEALVLLITAWALWRLMDILAAQRRMLTDNAVTIRLYREMRNDSDRQVGDLLGQNTRLALKIVDLAAAQGETPPPRMPVAAWPARRES